MGLNVRVNVDAAVFQKDTEAPEVRFDGGEGDLVKYVEVERRIVELEELTALGIAVAFYSVFRIQSNPLMSRLSFNKLLGRVADIYYLRDLAYTHLYVDGPMNLSQ